jgi:hypothetical protein
MYHCHHKLTPIKTEKSILDSVMANFFLVVQVSGKVTTAQSLTSILVILAVNVNGNITTVGILSLGAYHFKRETPTLCSHIFKDFL